MGRQMVMIASPPSTRAVRVVGPDTPWYRRRSALIGARLAVGVALVLLWWIASEFEWLPPAILPTPLEVVRAFGALAVTADFWVAFFQTLAAAMTALGLSIIIGVPIGLVLGLAPAVERTTRFLLDLGRSFPVIALLPVMILVLGATTQMEVTVVFLGVVWPILLQTIYGSRRMDPVIRDTMKSYRINLAGRFVKVLLPGAAPLIMTGIRVSAAISILLAIGVELLGRTPGMGFNLGNALVENRPDIALAYVLYAGLLGMGLNYLLQFIEDKTIVWNARGDRTDSA